jgi:hypothetical protein
MSAIVVIPVVFPAAAAAWPAIAAAAGAAAGALGFAAGRTAQEIEQTAEVELPMENAEAAAAELSVAEETVFVKDDVQVIFYRDVQGKAGVRVCGQGHRDDELRAIGEQMANAIAQQYAYHRLKTELLKRNFNIAAEEVEEDGTVRLQVRTFQA